MSNELPSGLAGLVREEISSLEVYRVPRHKVPSCRAKLDSNELPWPLPPDVARELGRLLAEVELNRYPAGDCAELRQVVAGQLGVDPLSLVFGNGSGELIGFLFSVFARPRPGRARAAVLYPVPTFVFYRTAAVASGVEPVEVPLGEDFVLDRAAVEARLAERGPNVVVFARPNNPTGTLWDREAILAVARAHRDIVVVVDEAYIDYGGDTLLDEVAALPNLLILRTLSKLGLAGLRIGFLHGNSGLVHQLEKVRPPYNIGALNQRVASWLLENHHDLLQARCRSVVKERDDMTGALAQFPGVRVFPSHANHLLVDLGTAEETLRAWQVLAGDGVMVRRFEGVPSLASCLRVSVGRREENDLFLASLASHLEIFRRC